MQILKDISFNWKDYLFDLYMSNDVFEFRKKFAGNDPKYFAPNFLANSIAQIFLKNPDDVNYERLEEVLCRNGLHRVAVLHAHGRTMDGLWQYSDQRLDFDEDIKWEYNIEEEKIPNGTRATISRFKRIDGGLLLPMEGGIFEVYPVDSWIAQQENKGYGALILVCCNEDSHKPLIQRTPIIYCAGNIGLTADYKTILLEPKEKPAPTCVR